MNQINKKRLKICAALCFLFVLLVPNLIAINIPFKSSEKIPQLKVSYGISVVEPDDYTVVDLTVSTSLYVEWTSGFAGVRYIDIYLCEYYTPISDLGHYGSAQGTNSRTVTLPSNLEPGSSYRIKVEDSIDETSYAHSWSFTINNDNYVYDYGGTGDEGPQGPNIMGAILLLTTFIIGAFAIIGLGGVKTVKSANERKSLSSNKKTFMKGGTPLLFKCNNCHSSILKGDKFCHKCGTPIY